jgi:mycothiol S-conjugate amidase
VSDRCLLTVHAHPDDESSKGAGTVAKYHDDGVRTVLVCCTGGEEGDILNPAMDRDDVRADLPAVRREELARAADVIGYDEVIMLGYRDSGMPESEANARPEAFANAPLDEAVGRLVEIIRRERPQVVVTYGDDQEGYPHPDHLMVHDITMPAIDRAADPEWYPEAGDPHQVAKVYWTSWSRARMVAMHEKFVELGLESPFDEKWFERPSQDDRITTRVPIHDYGDVRWDALLAHATQIDPESPFWFGLPRDVAAELHPWDDYQLARSEVASDESTGDLFDGIE